MKRKIVLLGACVLMIGALTLGSSLAYFTDREEAENVFTVGNVSIELTEPNWEGQGAEDAPEVYPGEALAKDPTVENVGANPCFVRIRVEGLDQFGDAGMIRYRTNYVLDALGEGWEHCGEDFYYNAVLEVGEKTAPVFDSIVIPVGLENGDAESLCTVTVSAQAVQAQGARASFADVKTMTVPQIAEWFAVCGM